MRAMRARKGLQTFARLSKVMLEDRKRVIFQALDKQGVEALSETEKNYLKGRDLLSALVKANADPAIPDNQKMTDNQVLDRTFRFVSFFSFGRQV